MREGTTAELTIVAPASAELSYALPNELELLCARLRVQANAREVRQLSNMAVCIRAGRCHYCAALNDYLE